MGNLTFFFCFLLLFSQAYSQSSRWIISLNKPSNVEQASSLCLSEDCGVEVLEFSELKSESQIKALLGNSNINFIEPDASVSAFQTPNDPDFGLQWALQNNGQDNGISGLDIGALQAWQNSTGDTSIVVGILDSGIDWDHPDLIHNIWQNLAEDADGDGKVLVWDGSSWVFDPDDVDGIDNDGNGYIDDFVGWDFVNNDNDPSDDHISGHGTHVSGIIGAKGDNGIGIAGVAWNVQLMALKFLDANGSGYTSDAIAALNYAVQMGAQISNHSWGGGTFSTALNQAIDNAKQQNHLMVAAAGNNFGNDNDKTPLFPASYSQANIISVGASTNKDEIATFSNIGLASVDLFAPGVKIYSTLPDGAYGFQSGSSMAAPMVSGALAIILSQRRSVTFEKARDYLNQAVLKVKSMDQKSVTGGRLDLSQVNHSFQYLQKETDHPEKAGYTSPEGHFYRIGNTSQYGWMGRFDGDGNQIWLNKYDGLTLNGLTGFQNEIVIAGKTNGSSGKAIAISIDSMGATSWNHEFQSVSPTSSEVLVPHNDKLYVIGTYNIWGSYKLWVSQIDDNGNVDWVNSYFNFWRSWKPKSASVHNNNELLILGQENFDKSFLFKLSLQNNNNQENEPTILTLNESGLLPVGLGEHPNLNRMFSFHRKVDQNGEAEIVRLEWETGNLSIQNSEKISVGSPLNVTASVHSAGNTRIISSFEENGQNGIWYAELGTNNIKNQRTYWPEAGDLKPSWLSSRVNGEVLFSISNDQNNHWIKTDSTGNSPCNTSSANEALSTFPTPSTNSQNVSVTSLNWQTNPTSLNQTSLSLNSQILCDETDCQTVAYFDLPTNIYCGGMTITPTDLSQQASDYQWFWDKNLISTTSTPSISAPNLKGDYELNLIVGNGICKDSFTYKITVEDSFDIANIDTTHCGKNLNLAAPIINEKYAYLWTDSSGNTIGTGAKVTISQSGLYELSITNICGFEAKAHIQVVLQPGCVWPGDADANGIVNLQDYLTMGLIHGQTGPSRTNPVTSFIAQIANSWTNSFSVFHSLAPGVNYNHSDANGDGIVDADTDGLFVKKYFQSDITGEKSDSSLINLNIAFTQDSADWKDTVEFEVRLENSDNSVIQDLYGAAFTFEYDLPLSAPVQIKSDASWLGSASETDTLCFKEISKRKVHFAITRLDQNGKDGSGIMAQGIIIIIVDDVGTTSLMNLPTSLTLNLSSAMLIRADGSQIPLTNSAVLSTSSIVINPPNNNPKVQVATTTMEEEWKLGPNPASSIIRLFPPKVSELEKSLSIDIISVTGQVIQSQEIAPQKPLSFIELDIQNLPTGYYWLRFNHLSRSVTLPFMKSE